MEAQLVAVARTALAVAVRTIERVVVDTVDVEHILGPQAAGRVELVELDTTIWMKPPQVAVVSAE